MLINPTVANANIVNAQSSGTPSIINSCEYHGNSKNTKHPHSKPLIVLVVTAALIAYVALPCCAKGNPSTMVAAALLAPGIPNNIPVKLSPVVLAATTAIRNITPRYGSSAKYGIRPYNATRPVVAPAPGMIPTISP